MHIGGGNKSRSRRKLNYNSFYNSSLSNNGYLARHPENRKQPYVVRNHAFSYATSTDASRSTLASPFYSPPKQVTQYYVMEETTTISLAAQSFEEVINEAEDGELLAIEAKTSSPLVTIEIVVYGMGNSPNVINDYSINDLVELGRGLTPGDVEELPGNRSKDTAGTPLRYYPYVGRYKSDVLVDFFGKQRQTYVFRYEPSIPMPYSSIIVNVKNTSTESDKTVDFVNIHRRVFEDPFADNLAGTPIESALVFNAPEAVDDSSIPSGPVEEPIPNNTSPYIANYLKRQEEQKAQALEPEVLPVEEF